MTIMMLKHQFFIVLILSLLLYIENGEAGWKFWKKDQEATTTTTTITTTTITPSSINVQTTTTSTKAITEPTVNTGTIVTGAVNPGPAISMGNTRQNVRNNAQSNRLNPGTEIGMDIAVSRPNRPGIGGGRNGQSYRDWALDFTGAGTPIRNEPSRTPAQGLATNINSRTQPNPSTGPTVSSTTVDQNNPYRPSNEKTWADVAAGGAHRSASPTSPPKQPEYSDENERRTTPGAPTHPSQSHQPNRSALPGVAAAGTIVARTGATVITDHVSDSTRKVYSSNPTYSKGNTITDEDLEKLSEALYIKESNNANRYITINLQKQTTSSSPTDQAPQPLLTVNPEAFQIPTIQRVLSIFDNYQLDTQTNEHINPAQRQEESLLVDTFLSTNVMSAAMRFLADKEFIRQDYYEYKDILRRIWFNLFSRGKGKIGSTGFEHIFMAETKQVDSGIEVLGLHNWIFFNAEEIKNHIDYLGYIKKIDLGNKGFIIKMHAKFNGFDKPVTTVFVGTSPELEMALYTVCFYARPDGNCPVSLGGTKFNIITHKFRYRGKDLIGTAYPDI